MIAAGHIGSASRIVFVDDGSRDRTWSIIHDFSDRGLPVVGIKLSRNSGHQNALLAGLFSAPGDVLISLDADLQDDLSVVETMVNHFRQGADVVYGVRRERKTDTLFKRATAELFYTLMSFLGTPIIHNHADYRLLSRRAVEALKNYREVNLFLRGVVTLLGFRSAIVIYDRSERFAGQSKYPLRKMLLFAIDGITSFSVVPLRFVAVIGFGLFLLSVFVMLWVLWIRLDGGTAVPGWASTLLPILFLSGVQLLSLGVVGEYVGKIYSEVKSRPRYIIETTVGHDKDA